MLKIKYFAKIAEITGKSEENFPLENSVSLKEIEGKVVETYPKIGAIIHRIAVNQSFEDDKNTMINKGDEIAFFPPFAGG